MKNKRRFVEDGEGVKFTSSPVTEEDRKNAEAIIKKVVRKNSD
jgi:hypothetical protein